MTKPIGSYVSGNNGILQYLEETYGSYLEELSPKEKLYLIGAIADNLLIRANGKIHERVYPLKHELFRLTTSDQEGLIEAMIAELRGMQ